MKEMNWWFFWLLGVPVLAIFLTGAFVKLNEQDRDAAMRKSFLSCLEVSTDQSICERLLNADKGDK